MMKYFKQIMFTVFLKLYFIYVCALFIQATPLLLNKIYRQQQQSYNNTGSHCNLQLNTSITSYSLKLRIVVILISHLFYFLA